MSLSGGVTELSFPLFAPIVASASGATTIVTNAFPLRKLRVIAANVIASNAVNVKWQTSTGPVDLTGLAYLTTNGGYILPYNAIGWFETLPGDNLLINLSGAIPVGGHITYILP